MKTTRENRRIAWALVAVALAASAVGSAFDLYDAYRWFDKILHGYAVFAYTLVLALFAYGTILTGAERHRLVVILAAGSLGLALGVA